MVVPVQQRVMLTQMHHLRPVVFIKLNERFLAGVKRKSLKCKCGLFEITAERSMAARCGARRHFTKRSAADEQKEGTGSSL